MIPIARAILFTLLAVMAVPPAAQAQRLALDAGSERRIDALLARMTLAEKIGQLNLLARDERTSLQMDEVRAGRSGAIMNVVKPDEIRGFREAAAGTRLGIPLIIGLDAIHSFSHHPSGTAGLGRHLEPRASGALRRDGRPRSRQRRHQLDVRPDGRRVA